MALQIFFCVLAAAGLVLLCWCAIGALLLPMTGPALSLVWRVKGDAAELEQIVRAADWFRGTGLLDLPLHIVDCGLSDGARQRAEKLAVQHPDIQIIPMLEYLEQVENGTTAGTDSRDGGRGGISE